MVSLFGVQEKNLEELGIPYQGSKRKLSKKILKVIQDHAGNFTIFYDLFGGGGSVSLSALQLGYKVFYNDLNTSVVNLLKHILAGGELPKHFVTREEFAANKGGDNWYAGFLKTGWSFGNNMQSYIYGKDIEEWKHALHDICYADRIEDIIFNFRILEKRILKKPYEHTLIFDDDKADYLLSLPKGSERRYKLRFCVKDRNWGISHFETPQLGRLQSLESLGRLELSNKSYLDFSITEGVIYCDIPYKNDKEKKNYGVVFNHSEFYEWALNQSVPVYISEYNMPSEFIEVDKFGHRQTLSAIANKFVIEKLFWNGVKNGN